MLKAESDMTFSMLKALEARSRAAIAEANDAAVVARAACIIAMLPSKLPNDLFATASGLVIIPELWRRKATPPIAGVSLSRSPGGWSPPHSVHLEGVGVSRLEVPGGLIIVAREPSAAEAIVTGRTLGSEIPVSAGPVAGAATPDAFSALCWVFCGGVPIPASITDAVVRVHHPLSKENGATLIDAARTATRKAERARLGAGLPFERRTGVSEGQSRKSSMVHRRRVPQNRQGERMNHG